MKNQYQYRGVMLALLTLLLTFVILNIVCPRLEQIDLSFFLPAIVDLTARFMIVYIVFGYSFTGLKIGVFLFMYAKYLSVLSVFFAISHVHQIQNILEAIGVTAVAIQLFWFFKETLGDQLWKLAFSDHLTGLMNRGAFLNESRKTLKACLQKTKPAAVVYLDLDRFKSINDKHGHHMGDHVLELIGERLRSVVRKNDLVGRVGGDEFVIVLADIDQRNVEEIVQRLIKTLSCPIIIDDNRFCIGVSAGVAIFPQDGETIEDLIKKADKAMYKAKNKSVGYIFYSQLDVENN
ncbi:GGDEF domain-containing protein [Thermotoga profunda]|uniref:GGDEF domain-containing protein n=1 Tax=Thermotoga profunda TaxID=1508420 RepID=UPI000693F398|nr:GGDEF domain-containing protein [Thermotoga profunda]